MGVVDKGNVGSGEKTAEASPPDGGRPDVPGPRAKEATDEGRPEVEEQFMFMGMSMYGVLRNQDPTRRYHFANKKGMYDVNYYRHLGFKVEQYEGDDGVGLLMDQGSYEPGSPIECGGQVLMSIDLERWRRMVQVAQRQADVVEQGYLSKEAGEVDVMRGRHGNNELVYRKSNVPQGFSMSQNMRTQTVTE